VAEAASAFTGVTMLLVNDTRLANIDEATLGRYVKSNDILEYDADGYFESLQAAVDNSNVNAEVVVTAHIFDEAVSISTGVRLRGAKAGQDARLRTTSSGETLLTQTLSVHASGVQIDGFSMAPAIGPAIQADLGDIVGVTVKNNFIDGGSGAISLQRALSATIVQNLIQNIAGPAIDVGDDAGTPDVADDVRTVAVIENNEVVNSTFGIRGYMSFSLVANNEVRDFPGAGGAAVSGQLLDTNVESNMLTGYGSSPGILLTGAPNRALTTNTVFKCNDLSGNQIGVRADASQTSLAGVAVSSNNVSGNVIGAVNDATATTLDAAFNWWGCPVGPGNAGCDSTAGFVDASAPLSAVSDCSGCFQDVDCDDGAQCNGAETCDIGNNLCLPGTPLSCGATGSDADCNTGSCQEGTGCVLTPVGDGTLCDDGVACSVPASCSAGSCVNGGNGDADGDLVCQIDDNCPNQANPDQADADMDGIGDACDSAMGFLNVDRASIKGGFGSPTGKIVVKGSFSVDPASGESFDAGGTVTATIIEGNGQVFAISFPPAECTTKKGKTNCRTADKKIKAKFKPNKKEQGTFKYKLQFRKQSITGPFSDPLTVRIEHSNGLTRQGSFDVCPLTGFTLICK